MLNNNRLEVYASMMCDLSVDINTCMIQVQEGTLLKDFLVPSSISLSAHCPVVATLYRSYRFLISTITHCVVPTSHWALGMV